MAADVFHLAGPGLKLHVLSHPQTSPQSGPWNHPSSLCYAWRPPRRQEHGSHIAAAGGNAGVNTRGALEARAIHLVGLPIAIGRDISVVKETFRRAVRSYTTTSRFVIWGNTVIATRAAQPAPQRNTEAISSRCPWDILFAARHPEENKSLRIITAEAARWSPLVIYSPE